MKPPKGRGQPVLYLDFGGVLMLENVLWRPRRDAYLHAPPGYRLFQRAGLLAEMLQPYPGIRVVLSSSRTRQQGCSGVAKRLPSGVRSPVIRATCHSRMPSRGKNCAGRSRGWRTCSLLPFVPPSQESP